MSSWVDGFPSAAATVDCAGAEHRIAWKHGKLTAVDHDAASERALAALGGDLPLCIELVEGWRTAMRDPTLLVTLLRSPVPLARPDYGQLRATQLGGVTAALAQLGVTSVRRRGSVRSFEHGRWLRTLTENSPAELRRVLIAAMAMSCARAGNTRGIASEFMMDDVVAAMALETVYESVRSWAPPGGFVRLPIHVKVTFEPDEHAPVFLVEHLGAIAAVRLGLPLEWIADVWARGIALVDGCLVLEVLERRARGTAMLVRAVRWERHRGGGIEPVEAEAVIVRTDDGSWHLGWHGPAA